MRPFTSTLYYKRDEDMDVQILPKRKNKLHIGDSLLFFGNLYKEKTHTTEVAKTFITYFLQHTSESSSIIHVVVDIRFNKNSMYGIGKLVLEGTLSSPNFRIANGKVQDYTTEPCTLAVVNGDKAYLGAYGTSKYVIYGTEGGKMTIHVELP